MYEIKTNAKLLVLARAGAASLGMSLDEALVCNQWITDPEVDNMLMDRLRALAKRLGLPVPPKYVPLREVMQAIAPVIRDELERGKRERHGDAGGQAGELQDE